MAGSPEDQGPARKLTTILSADGVGYSRLMRSDEEGTWRTLRQCRAIIDRLITARQGRLFGHAGDSVIAEFSSPVETVRCAVEIQRSIADHNSGLPEAQRMAFRIGINLGDVLIDGDNLIGDGVNVAARLQALAEPGGICISATVHDQVRTRLDLGFADLGEQRLKNIAEPVRAFRIQAGQGDQRPRGSRPWRRPSRIALAAVLALVVVAATVAALGLASLPSWIRSGAAPVQSTGAVGAVIAVLPFENLSGDATQDYFSDGLTEDLIAALGRFPDLAVVAKEAVRRFKGQPPTLDSLARDLGVRYVLEGSVRRDGIRVRVTAQLVDAASGRHLWSDRYDGEIKDVFTVQDEITRSVAGALAVKLVGLEKQRALMKQPDSLEAYDYVLRGRDLAARDSRADNAQARALFERAIAIDPRYASAYVGLGMARLKAAGWGWTEFPDDALHQAERFAQSAIDLDPESAEAHALLAGAYLNLGRYDVAGTEVDKAIALNPSDAGSYAARGSILLFTGHPKEAIAAFETAQRLNPNTGSGRLEPVGWAYYLAGRYDDAVRALESGLSKSPKDYFIHAGLAATYAEMGRAEAATAAAQALLKAWPFFEVGKFAEQFQRAEDRARIAEGLRKAGLR
jgi:TolB-like protein/class 3 adenylate cyclase/tetratricopeptide (TPR) repeat protein